MRRLVLSRLSSGPSIRNHDAGHVAQEYEGQAEYGEDRNGDDHFIGQVAGRAAFGRYSCHECEHGMFEIQRRQRHYDEAHGQEGGHHRKAMAEAGDDAEEPEEQPEPPGGHDAEEDGVGVLGHLHRHEPLYRNGIEKGRRRGEHDEYQDVPIAPALRPQRCNDHVQDEG